MYVRIYENKYGSEYDSMKKVENCVNNCRYIKALMKVIKTEAFNVGFTSQ